MKQAKDFLQNMEAGQNVGMDLEEMVTRAFARCSNFPKERSGIIGLAQGLGNACERFRVAAERVIERSIEISVYCPTDTDLFNVARDLAPAKQQPSGKCPHSRCDGSGWLEVLHLHTHHVGDDTRPAYVEKEIISRQVYNAFAAQFDAKRRPYQMAYESRYRCSCHPPKEEEREKRGKYA